jgi:L-threonylcarbamoyladenylate synthase
MTTRTWTPERAAAIAAEAAEVLARGELVALPTETVYGLAARADSAEACAKIYEAKRRPATHPLIVHVASLEAARPLVAPVAHAALARWGARFWPGPLTLVLPRTAVVPDLVAAGGSTVALRVPAHPVMAAVLARCPFGLAAPSANRYQAVSPTTAAHVARGLGAALELLIDGGPCAVGLESTIVAPSLEVAGEGDHEGDERQAPSRVLRLGGLALEELRAFEPGLVVDAGSDEGAAIHAAPGRDRKHYAPRCAIAFVAHADALPAARGGTGYLTYGEAVPSGVAFARALPSDAPGYARELFAALHEAEESGVHTLYVRILPAGDPWAAARDRLERAAVR